MVSVNNPAAEGADRSKYLHDYEHAGYVLIPGLSSPERVDAVREVNYNLYRRFVDDSELDAEESPWNSAEFDTKLIELRSKNPQVFGAIYDGSQHSIESLRLLTCKDLVSWAATLLRDRPRNLSYSGTLIRMDCPSDSRNALMWHQDQSYYPQNMDPCNGLVASVALQDVSIELGALQVCCGSQRHGSVTPTITDRQDSQATLQRTVPDEVIGGYQQVHATMKAGDTLFLNMNTIHRSGINSSNRIRFSALCRFHRMITDDYVPYRILPPKLNDFILAQVVRSADNTC